MIQSLRVFVAVVAIFAAVGCQKGAQSGAGGNGGAKEAGSGSKSTETPAKAEESSPRGGDATAGAGSEVYGKSGTLTLEDDGSTLDLRVGQVVTVVLGCNRSAGLSWAMAEPTAAVLVPMGKPVYAATTRKADSDRWSGTETWRFRAAQRGRQTLRLEYLREWQRDVPERTFRFTANVK